MAITAAAPLLIRLASKKKNIGFRVIPQCHFFIRVLFFQFINEWNQQSSCFARFLAKVFSYFQLSSRLPCCSEHLLLLLPGSECHDDRSSMCLLLLTSRCSCTGLTRFGLINRGGDLYRWSSSSEAVCSFNGRREFTAQCSSAYVVDFGLCILPRFCALCFIYILRMLWS